MTITEDELRIAEIRTLRRWFPPSGTVLELGGGSGLQAHEIRSWGLTVVSVDLPRRDRGASHFAVVDYDGLRLPARGDSCDVVFSSNVLEHVVDLDGLLAETRRVLRGGGLAIHVLPSVAWRAWTSLAHPAASIGKIVRGQRTVSVTMAAGEREATGAPLVLLRRGLFAAPHGEFPSATRELVEYSVRRWAARFARAGFVVEDSFPTGIFYTSQLLTPLSLSSRRRLSRVLGSAAHVFVLR